MKMALRQRLQLNLSSFGRLSCGFLFGIFRVDATEDSKQE